MRTEILITQLDRNMEEWPRLKVDESLVEVRREDARQALVEAGLLPKKETINEATIVIIGLENTEEELQKADGQVREALETLGVEQGSYHIFESEEEFAEKLETNRETFDPELPIVMISLLKSDQFTTD